MSLHKFTLCNFAYKILTNTRIRKVPKYESTVLRLNSLFQNVD
jgi:hypothetical protein